MRQTWVMGLEEDVADLTARVAELERRLAASPAAASPPATTWPPTPPPPMGAPSPLPPPPGAPGVPPPGALGLPPSGGLPPPSAGAAPVAAVHRPKPDWITTETLLRWAGLLLVVLAAVFFVATAISRGWIGPELQLLGATLIGLAMLAAAVQLAPDRRPWAFAFGCGGAVVVPICAAAANAELDLIGPYPSLVFVALAVVLVAAVALVRDMEAVIAVGVVVAGFAMLWVVDVADLPPLVPGSWLAVAAVAGSVVGWVRRWAVARIVIVVLSAFELLVLLIDGPTLTSAEQAVGVTGIVMVGIVALLGPLIADRRAANLDGWRSSLDRRVVVLGPLWTWTAGSAAVMFTSTAAFVAAGLVGAALVAGWVAVTWNRVDRALSAAYVSATATLVLASVFAATDGPVLLVALAVVSVAGVLIGRWFDDLFGLVYSLCLGIIALLWTAGIIVDGLIEPTSWSRLAATGVVIGLVALGAFAVERWGEANQSVPLLVTGWVGAVGWTAAAFVHGPQGQVVVSLIWAGAAIGALMVGVTLDRALFRGFGLATLLLVLAKLLTVDLASVDPLWRVGLFLVVGAGLMRLGYVLPRLSARAKAQLP